MLDASTPISTFRAGLSGLSLGEQKQIFDALPDVFQAALWQDRLREGMAAIDDRAQGRTFAELCDLLSPDSYSDDEKNKAAVGYIDELAPRIEQLFPDQSLFQKYTQTLGDNHCPEDTVEKAKGGVPTCTCSSDRSCLLRSNDCGALLECKKGYCNKTRWGCGVLWLQSCDGLCTGDFC